MNFTRIKAISKKEWLHIIRDPRSLGMAIAIPILLLVLFGFALTLDVDQVPLVIWDQDKSQASRDFILNFENSSYFRIIGYPDHYVQMEDSIDRNKALIGIIIPYDFARDIQSNQVTPVQLLVDGSDSNTALIAIGYVEGVVQKYNRNLIVKKLSVFSLGNKSAIDMRPRVWFNADLKSKNYIIPGLIAVIMMVIASLLTSLTVAREWERGTMEQLISTPVKPRELVLGKLIPYFFIGMLDVLIAVIMGEFIFHIPLRGNVILLFVLSGFFLAGALSLGILISIQTKSQLLASQLAMVMTFLPAFLLSGFMYAISNMPPAIQMITYLVPARYFVVILKGIYLKGVGLNVLGTQVLFLFLFSLIVINLAVHKFQKRIA